MRGESPQLTSYADVNSVVHGFLVNIQVILGSRFRGMYLFGSLALDDFDPRSSDIDFVVVTDGTIPDDLFIALQNMHARFDAGDSPWAARVEAVYISQDALRRTAPSEEQFPQVERATGLFKDRLERGWIFQCYVLRERGIVVAGPDPRTLIDPINPDDMRRAVAVIPAKWLEQAHSDPSWLDWVHHKRAQAFVILTLCRLLYTLDCASVASKPFAARWAQKVLDRRWANLIERARVWQHEDGNTLESDVDETVAFIQYTFDRYQQWSQSQQKS